MNLEQARSNMIEQQILPQQVLEPSVGARLSADRRELFVPARYRNLAFADTQIPLGHGACMLSPAIEARLLNTLRLKAEDRVLEIGTGSGHMAALLAARAWHVESIEIEPALLDVARANLASAGVNNVRLRAGDGLDPATIQNDYDVIVLSGSLPLLPPHLSARLKPGGRMIAIVGSGANMEVQLVTRGKGTSCITTTLFETVVPALRNAPRVSTFKL